MIYSPLTQTDFYKVNHFYQYPKGTEVVFSNGTARSQNHFNREVDGVIFFGLQRYLLKHLIDEWDATFFNIPKEMAVERYKRRIDSCLGEDAITYDHIEELHDLGYLPLVIRALPEGTTVPFKVPMYTMYNTKKEFYWVTNYIESSMSSETWKPTTVATIAKEYRKILEHYAEATGADKGMIPFNVHDFSFRGMSGMDDAANSGGGHLLSFVGSDNIPAIDSAEYYYGAGRNGELIGTSIPASEHSVMCVGGKEGEFETYKRFLTELYPNGLVGIVSDTWDLWKVLTEVAPALKDEIMARDGKVVFRPDSGNPVDILCGTSQNSVGETNEEKGAVQILWEQFGGTVNEKGFKELDSHVGLIYGDSITLDRCEAICRRLKDKGFSTGNVVFGVGSYTYQMITRDTFGIAIKATYCEVDGEPRNIFKDPVTDDGTKKSATGLLRVVRDSEGNLVLEQECTWEEVESDENEMKIVFWNGEIRDPQTFAEIRQRVWPTS